MSYIGLEGIRLDDVELKQLKLNKKKMMIKLPEDLQKYYSDNHAKNYVIYNF